MEIVAFINSKISKKGDLILSFAIEDGASPGGIRSLILLRCPKYEHVLEESERGIEVSMEGEKEEQGTLAARRLTELALDASANTISVKTASRSYDLDIRKAKAQALADMRGVLAKMNFDGKAKIVGV